MPRWLWWCLGWLISVVPLGGVRASEAAPNIVSTAYSHRRLPSGGLSAVVRHFNAGAEGKESAARRTKCSAMPYARVTLHFVWTTAGRLPLLTARVEEGLHRYIGHKCQELGAHLFVVNGDTDHLHLIVNLPLRLSPAYFVKRIKGATSRFLNDQFFDSGSFRWQREYAVLSIGRGELRTAIAYVQNQKEHHAADRLLEDLEPRS